MKESKPATSGQVDVRRHVMQTIGQAAFHEFNVAFSLMSLIPLTIGAYILAARLFTFKIFEGLNGFFFFLAIAIALLGFFVGRRLIQLILKKLIDVNVEVRQHELIKSAFIANVAYELRPPLSAVQLSLKNVEDGLLGPLTDPQRATVKDCSAIVGRLVRLTTDLIESADPDQATSPLQLDVLELQDVLREALRVTAPYLAAHRLTVEPTFPATPVLFYGDRVRLLQAFGSLLDHAVRWGSEGSRVTIELASVVPAEWRIVVTHDVAGQQADFARALDTFSRLGGRMEEPLGLGLRVAKEIVELHHGRLWVEGEPGRSSRLIITLPAVQDREPSAQHDAPPST